MLESIETNTTPPPFPTRAIILNHDCDIFPNTDNLDLNSIISVRKGETYNNWTCLGGAENKYIKQYGYASIPILVKENIEILVPRTTNEIVVLGNGDKFEVSCDNGVVDANNCTSTLYVSELQKDKT